jgi:hypothetical protein
MLSSRNFSPARFDMSDTAQLGGHRSPEAASPNEGGISQGKISNI